MTDEFNSAYFTRLARAGRHWWVVGMLDVSRRLLGPVRLPVQVLDAGCGTGANFDWLRELARGPFPAIDFSWNAMRICRELEPRPDLAQASVTATPFATASFDLIVSSDVLQHLTTSDARLALEEVYRLLRPGGRLLVRTNAAFGRSRIAERPDWRMYRPDTLRAEMEQAGLSVERLTYANCIPAVAAVVRGALTRPAAGHGGHGGQHDHGYHDGEHDTAAGGLGIPTDKGKGRARVLGGSLALEARWLSRPGRTLPFGHTLLAVARRPTT